MGEEGKILVVDDEAVIRELLTDILVDEGYDVEALSSGPEALDMLRRDGGFVLLFTDIMMPDMDGIQLIREARRVQPSLIPVVMTGFATLETARAAVREGAYDYVLKPFSLSEIKLAVLNAFERYHLTNENARLLELTELFRISENIASIRDEEELLDFVLRAALERVDASRGSLMLTTPDGKTLEVAASFGIPDEAIKKHAEMGSSISGLVAQRGEALLVEDIEQQPEVAQISHRLQDHSFISVPLERKISVNGESIPNGRPRVLAVMNVSEKRKGAQFTEGDLKILRIVANHAAAAIENVRLIKDIEHAHLATLQSMALLLEARDTYTHGHSQRVTDYSILLAQEMGLPEADIETLRVGAPLHDIGKVGVPDAVLNKKDRLTDDEWAMIKQHPEIGDGILEAVTFLSRGHRDLVRYHHERVDGKGYPDGLDMERMPPMVRIISVVDAYDAMSADRAYRKAMPMDAIVTEFHRCAGSQFDAPAVAAFLALIERGVIRRPSDS